MAMAMAVEMEMKEVGMEREMGLKMQMQMEKEMEMEMMEMEYLSCLQFIMIQHLSVVVHKTPYLFHCDFLKSFISFYFFYFPALVIIQALGSTP